jgi:hypothetical protein
MCQITLNVQFVFQNMSGHTWCSLLCFRMCQIVESDLTHSETQAEQRAIWHILKHKLKIESDLTHSETQTEHGEQSMFSFCFRMCQITLNVQFVFQNMSGHTWCSLLCFRMCQIVESDLTHSETQAEHRERSDTFWNTIVKIKSDLTYSEIQTEHWEWSFSLCVSECVRSLSMFSFCFRMCQITLNVQFESDPTHSE